MSQSGDEEEANVEVPAYKVRYSEIDNRLLEKIAIMANKIFKSIPEIKETREKEVCTELAQQLGKESGRHPKDRNEFEELGQGEWQVIIGKKFASALTYDTGVLVFFDLIAEGKSILIFKSG